MEEINVILNNKPVKAREGMSVLELARENGYTIPTLCHDPRLEPFSSCFLCVVEIEGMKGLQPSCSTRVKEGMVIVTDNAKIRKARRTVLELMLSNHFADCMAPCRQNCPAGVDVQGYISLIEKGLYSEAIALIKEVNPLPAICGRVCVRPCELACRRNLLGEGAPVGIDYLKRFAADRDLESCDHYRPPVAPATGKKVAVIGGGPGGLSCAYFLQQKGHQCDIYEAAPQPGGWLRYGIPEYRLPNDVLDHEISTITELGVQIFCNRKLGEDLTYETLQEEYDAVILTIGSQKGTLVGCEGEDALNVFPGIEFLRNMEMTGQRVDLRGKTVAVVGGGNTAMDCCRTSVRCGADKVYVIYRRTEKEMPANPIEVHESKLEGVEYLFLTNPKKINKNEKGEVQSVTCLKMKLGEPDASGRRRPLPVEGSEFDIPVDYILAAIGQKTDVAFLDEVNRVAPVPLKIDRWGNIEADPQTLQTNIPSVFAAGDGVTGPATIIEAIAQAGKASRSCHQFLTGEPVEPAGEEFISRKENFRPLVPEDLAGKYMKHLRNEMPTLSPDRRMNFKEVELGYPDEKVAADEASRCLECGCYAYFSCDLKKYATEYGATQKAYGGEFREYEVDFSHPFIEIDNNKCILCARCVRICHEVAGADALGLINRGFDTLVVPSMGGSLNDTLCESCGLCVSTCPTGAITENKPFKPGPVKTETYTIICPYCSVGCTLDVHHRGGFVIGVEGGEGQANPEGNICRYGRFGYPYMNDPERITTPLLRRGNEWKPLGFSEAFRLIAEKVKEHAPEKTALMGGARLSNEEQYLIQKLGRAGVGTPHTGSYHYLGTPPETGGLVWGTTPFEELKNAGKIYLIGSELNRDHPVVGFMVNQEKVLHNKPVIQCTQRENSSMTHKVYRQYRIHSYLHFLRALNYMILDKGLENRLFLGDRCAGMETYRRELFKQDFNALLEKSGFQKKEDLEAFVDEYIKEQHAVVIGSENELSPAACMELKNLTLLTGKFGKTGSGLILLNEKNNSQGLFDMGLHPELLPGNVAENDSGHLKRILEKWNVKDIPRRNGTDTREVFMKGGFRNMLVFGEDPVGCAADPGKIKKQLGQLAFLVVQDYTLTETARMAHLVLPASLPYETGGSYTSAGHRIQEFPRYRDPVSGMDNVAQLLELMKEFGLDAPRDAEEVKSEWMSLLPAKEEQKISLIFAREDNARDFRYGVDAVTKNFEDRFTLLDKNHVF